MNRRVTPRDLVLLWTRAAGMCSHPDCKKRLVLEATGQDEVGKIGHAAHIVAARPSGPRGQHAQDGERNRYENLILLCPTHHAEVDQCTGEYTVGRLMGWKAEHEGWVRVLTEAVRQDVPWTAIVQEEQRRIDVQETTKALGVGNSVAKTLELRTSPQGTEWESAARIERGMVEELMASAPAEHRRFAVFSLTRISLAVQLGFLLGDASRVQLFHYHRDQQSWAWPEGKREGGYLWPLRVKKGKGKGAASIRVSLSAPVREEDVKAAVETELDIVIAADSPSVRWLQWPEQLTELSRAYGDALAAIRQHGECRTVHLFFAGPGAGAVAFGRAYNPRMNPPLVLYEHRPCARPAYEPVLTLNGE